MFPHETKILVIDDEKLNRDAIKSHLKELGFASIQEASDGNEGFEMIKKAHETSEPFQLILTDWYMPNLSGLDLLRMLRAQKQWKNLPVLILTVESELKRVTKAIAEGASQYIVKPVDKETLERKLTDAWKGSRCVSS
jgi:two-component system chemotaxis response regulator CheY